MLSDVCNEDLNSYVRMNVRHPPRFSPSISLEGHTTFLRCNPLTGISGKSPVRNEVVPG